MWLTLLLLQAAAAPPPPRPTFLPWCSEAESPDEVVVCARGRDRYRLPLPDERPPLPRAAGGERTGMDALNPVAPCGIFAGQRRCPKREAAEFGYGQGRDPISVTVKVARKLTDPDSD